MSASQWKPGDVVFDPEYTELGVIVPVHASGCPSWHKGHGLHIHYGNGDWNTTSDRLRPLVVIDPEDREQVERLEDLYLRDAHDDCDDTTGCMQAALREFANPTPPKPEEPTGLGAVVEDADNVWVRCDESEENFDRPWHSPHTQSAASWDDLTSPVRVLSEGVTR